MRAFKCDVSDSDVAAAAACNLNLKAAAGPGGGTAQLCRPGTSLRVRGWRRSRCCPTGHGVTVSNLTVLKKLKAAIMMCDLDSDDELTAAHTDARGPSVLRVQRSESACQWQAADRRRFGQSDSDWGLRVGLRT